MSDWQDISDVSLTRVRDTRPDLWSD